MTEQNKAEEGQPPENRPGALAAAFDIERLFEHFSDSAIACVMWAKAKARELQLRSVDEDMLLFGIANQPENDAAQALKSCGLTAPFIADYLSKLTQGVVTRAGTPEVFTTATKDALTASANLAHQTRSTKVQPEHILYALLDSNSKLANSLLATHGADVEALESRLARQLRIDEFVLGAISSKQSKPARPARSLDQWFTKDAINAVSRAQDTAQSEGNIAVCAHHLLAELVPVHPWIPPDIEPKLAELLKYARGERDEVTDEAEFTDKVLKIFFETRRQSSFTDSQLLGTDNLLLATVKILTSADSEGLYGTLRDAYVMHLSVIARNKPRPESEPLVIDGHSVRATVRFITTLKRAHNHSRVTPDWAIGVPHLILALIEEARLSEVGFIGNRENDLAPAVKKLLEYVKQRSETRRSLNDIVESAAEHAKRLYSKRLDINHLALALLDEKTDEESILIVLRALGQGESRMAVRKRLEQCLLWQGAQQAYQAEPGVPVDWRNLQFLLSDG